MLVDWGMNVYKMVKFTPVDRRLFVSCVDFLLNYVARKLSFNYEILKKKFQQRKANAKTLLTDVIFIYSNIKCLDLIDRKT